MMRFWLCLALAAAATSAVAQPRSAVITNPDWVRLPSMNDLARYFPEGAKSTGRVVLRCGIQVDGMLADCLVMSEDPPDQGFGAAALRMTPLFKMRPMTRDGKPVGGGVVTLPIRFLFDGLTPPGWARRPTEDELKAVWPAAARGESGEAVLDCTVSIKGRASDCSVVSEAPRGKGFGAAALKLAPVLEFTPGKTGSAPTSMRSHIPITFPAPRPRQAGVGDFGGSLTGLINAPWKSAPGAAEVSAAWPKQAPAGLAGGHAVLRCRFKSDGGIDSCSVESEDPVGAGFGAAALSLIGRFQVLGSDPQTLAAARINLPFTFTNPAAGPAAPAQITEANWVKYIDADTMTSLYPPAASDAGVKTGRGVVECTVAAGGALTGCAPIGEEPAGMGFGKAAVEAAQYFNLDPWGGDGRPVDGAKIRIPIRFVEAPPPPDAAAPPAPAKPGGG